MGLLALKILWRNGSPSRIKKNTVGYWKSEGYISDFGFHGLSWSCVKEFKIDQFQEILCSIYIRDGSTKRSRSFTVRLRICLSPAYVNSVQFSIDPASLDFARGQHRDFNDWAAIIFTDWSFILLRFWFRGPFEECISDWADFRQWTRRETDVWQECKRLLLSLILFILIGNGTSA